MTKELSSCAVRTQPGDVTDLGGQQNMVRPRFGRVLAALVAGLAVNAFLGTAAGGSTSRRECGPLAAHTVLRRGAVRVYTLTASGDAFACDAASGDLARIANPRGIATFLLPAPAEAIAGNLVAFAQDDLSDSTYSQTVTFVNVLDLGGPPGPPDYVAVLPAQPSPVGEGAASKVVTTVLKIDGSVAWISCQRGSELPQSDIATGRKARCQGPGTYAWVYRENAAAEHGPPQPDGQYPAPTLLDQGRQIAPLSLRLHGSTLTWKHGAKVRSTTLA